MSSVTKTLVCCLPLWTRKVCPTNSGTIVQARFQVLIGSRFMPIPSTLENSFGSTYGPFLVERLIAKPPRPLYSLHPPIQNRGVPRSRGGMPARHCRHVRCSQHARALARTCRPAQVERGDDSFTTYAAKPFRRTASSGVVAG